MDSALEQREAVMFRTVLYALLIAASSSLAFAQEDLNDVYKSLQAADEKKDNDEVKKLAVQCFDLSGKVLNSPQPSTETDAEVWKTTQAQAKEIKTYAEYALNAAALRASKPAEKIELFEILEKGSPDSKYLQSLYTPVLAAQAQMKPDKSVAFAQHVIAKDPNNEDALLVVTDSAYQHKQYDAAVSYGTRLAKISKRGNVQGRAYWYAGMAYEAQGKHPQAAESLKASLPLVKGEPELLANAQCFIGVAEYNLARATQDKALMQEALKYSQMAATSGAAIGKQASQNAYAIKNDLARMR
jgi:tetratricopeptide (TPR) repeat protein